MKELDTYLNLCTQVYDLSKPAVPEADYNFYKTYLNNAKGKILEPMCGTGRFLLPFLQDGFEIQGFDASQSMLDALHEKAKIKGLTPHVWNGYVEQINPDDTTYNLIFIPSGSFGLLIDDTIANRALKTFYNILDDEGVLVLEVETLSALPNQYGVPRSSAYKRKDENIIIATFFNLPPENNVATTMCRYELVQNNQITQSEIETFNIRLYDTEQLTHKLKASGFSDVRLRKAFDHDRSPGDKDEVVIYECRK